MGNVYQPAKLFTVFSSSSYFLICSIRPRNSIHSHLSTTPRHNRSSKCSNTTANEQPGLPSNRTSVNTIPGRQTIDTRTIGLIPQTTPVPVPPLVRVPLPLTQPTSTSPESNEKPNSPRLSIRPDKFGGGTRIGTSGFPISRNLSCSERRPRDKDLGTIRPPMQTREHTGTAKSGRIPVSFHCFLTVFRSSADLQSVDNQRSTGSPASSRVSRSSLLSQRNTRHGCCVCVGGLEIVGFGSLFLWGGCMLLWFSR
jgi:hypothetical protein